MNLKKYYESIVITDLTWFLIMFCFFFIIYTGIVFLIPQTRRHLYVQNIHEQCIQKFGEQYEFRSYYSHPDMCINIKTGEGKYI